MAGSWIGFGKMTAALALLGLPWGLAAQRFLLSGFDAKAPDAVIVTVSSAGFWSETADPDGKLTVSYFDDPIAMQRIGAALKVDEPARIYPFACFDDLLIYGCRGGVAEVVLCTSDNCHQIRVLDPAGNERWNSYDTAYAFSGYFPFDGYKVGYENKVSYPDRAAAMADWNSFRNEPNLLFVVRPQWEKWDGTCEFRRELIALADSAAFHDTKAEIERQFPGIPFQLEMRVTDIDRNHNYSYHCTLKCPAEMGTRFRLWNANWQPYEYELTTYWRQ